MGGGFGACAAGDAATEPYVVTHHMLLAHAAAARAFRAFDAERGVGDGEIGIVLCGDWAEVCRVLK